MNTLKVAILLTGIAIGNAAAINDSQLDEIMQQCSSGDRTGARVAVVVLEEDIMVRAFARAHRQDRAHIDTNTALEIGSIPKTLTATLLAQMIVADNASLDDPLARHLLDSRIPLSKLDPATPASTAELQARVGVAATGGAEFHFERDAAGKVTALTLLQSGQQLHGVRQ